MGWLSGLLAGFKRRRETREQAALGLLKARYHGFRVLLADNEKALRLIAETERLLPGRDAASLSETARELVDTAYDLVDGLNRIADNRHAALYGLHRELAGQVEAVLDELAPDQSALPYCAPLDELDAEIRRSAGGKAGTLAFLRRSGLPVPDGFAVTTRACRRFLEASGLDRLVRRVMGQVELGKSVEVAGREIREAVLKAPFPDDLSDELLASWRRLVHGREPAVSLRSSALVEDRPEHSFAGQFQSVLNITTPEALLAAFREVLAGNFAARPTAYRRQAGLPLADLDMAALCQVMVPARAAGVVFTRDPAAPDSGRMLVTAVRGLGTTAVGGEAPADILRPRRDGEPDAEALDRVADQPRRDVAGPNGGLVREDVPEAERGKPALNPDELARLTALARTIESLCGGPQDIEWAVDAAGTLSILQSRPARLAARSGQTGVPDGETLLDGGVGASPGRILGQVRLARSARELREVAGQCTGLTILVLPQGLVEAAQVLPLVDGVIVELGNPADHLSCVARELGLPMLTGMTGALSALTEGQWIVLDADQGRVLSAPAEALRGLEGGAAHPRRRKRKPAVPLPPALARLHDLVAPLNLTDAYGPTFSVQECRSLHDLVRYVHEMAVLSMFEAGDDVLEAAGRLPRRLEDQPLHFLILDLGGGLDAPGRGGVVELSQVRCRPLLALCRGMDTPGLRWRKPPPGASLSGLMSRSITDAGSARPVGEFNYALITRDYLNLNARVDFHFAMIDAVCGPVAGENSVAFRFKGGGTGREQRERRARMVSSILKAKGFFTDRQGDMVTAGLREIPAEACEEALVLLGRLLGFTRLLDASMTGEDAVEGVARAFLDGDWGLERYEREHAQA